MNDVGVCAEFTTQSFGRFPQRVQACASCLRTCQSEHVQQTILECTKKYRVYVESKRSKQQYSDVVHIYMQNKDVRIPQKAVCYVYVSMSLYVAYTYVYTCICADG